MTKTLEEIAKAMRDIDFTMLATHGDGGAIAARPMSNNRQVDFDGTSRFFTSDDARMVAEIADEPKVTMSYEGKAGMLGLRPFFVAVEGHAALVRDKRRFAEHWTKDLDRWFEQGVDTPGVVMIEVAATRLHYWDGEDEGELTLPARTPA